MNNLVQTLMKQVGLQPYYDQQADQIEQFAKLIALECSCIAMTQHHSTSPQDYDDMELYEKGCDDTASAISYLIRRHFEVLS